MPFLDKEQLKEARSSSDTVHGLFELISRRIGEILTDADKKDSLVVGFDDQAMVDLAEIISLIQNGTDSINLCRLRLLTCMSKEYPEES